MVPQLNSDFKKGLLDLSCGKAGAHCMAAERCQKLNLCCHHVGIPISSKYGFGSPRKENKHRDTIPEILFWNRFHYNNFWTNDHAVQ